MVWGTLFLGILGRILFCFFHQKIFWGLNPTLILSQRPHLLGAYEWNIFRLSLMTDGTYILFGGTYNRPPIDTTIIGSD